MGACPNVAGFFFSEGAVNGPGPALEVSQQAARLRSHGLAVASPAELEARLRSVSYHRLSAYWHGFRQGDGRFRAGTTFDEVWRRYAFDRHLRLLVMDAVERVEVAVLRTRLVERFCRARGPLGHRQRGNLRPDVEAVRHAEWLESVDRAQARSRELLVEQFEASQPYGSPLPLWMAAELLSFGQLFTFYRFLNRADQRALAGEFGVLPKVLESWLYTLNYVRNVCAHHGRLWNRELPIRPLVPDARRQPAWHQPSPPENDRVYVVLLLLRHLLAIVAPQSAWQERLLALLERNPGIPRADMGFPEDWATCPLWARPGDRAI